MECPFAQRECDFLTTQVAKAGLTSEEIGSKCAEMAGELVPGVSVVKCPAELLMNSSPWVRTTELLPQTTGIENA